MKLSKDGKALMSLIATLRSEIAAKTATGGYVMEVRPSSGAAPYRWSVMPYEAETFRMLREAEEVDIEGAQLYRPITAGLYAIEAQYDVTRLLLGTIAKDCLTANKGVNCYRAHDSFYLTDGEIEIVFDNDEAPVSLPKH